MFLYVLITSTQAELTRVAGGTRWFVQTSSSPLFTLPMAMARTPSGGVSIIYLLPVL